MAGSTGWPGTYICARPRVRMRVLSPLSGHGVKGEKGRYYFLEKILDYDYYEKTKNSEKI